jgi:hypothetical protein
VVALLFVVYLVLWTNVRADAQARTLTDDLHHLWAGGTAGAPSPDPGSP